MVYYYLSSLLYSIAFDASLTQQTRNRSFPFLPSPFSPLPFLPLRVATSCRLSPLSQRLVCVLPKVSLFLSLTHASYFAAGFALSECPPL
jgi:hypothetical protein